MADASLLGLLPTGSVAAVLVVVIVTLLRQNHSDRSQYREHITRTEAEHAEEIKAIEKRNADQMGRVEQKLAEINTKFAEAIENLETERRKRWHAEDVAAEYRRGLEALGGIAHE